MEKIDRLTNVPLMKKLNLVFSVPFFLGRCKEDTFCNPAGRMRISTQDLALALVAFHMAIIFPLSRPGTQK